MRIHNIGILMTDEIQNKIERLVGSALECDVINNTGNGFIAIMNKTKALSVKADIPAATEAYSLLSHFLALSPFCRFTLDANAPKVEIKPSTFYDEHNQRIVTLINVGKGELEHLGHWLADNIKSQSVKQMSGTLALCFSIETHSGQEHLIPEWWSAFYIGSDQGRCIPLLVLKSFIQNYQGSGEWVDLAIARMSLFGLPCAKAREAANTFH